MTLKNIDINYESINSRKPKYFWTEERVIAAILEIKRQGFDLHAVPVQKSNGGLYNAALNCFGKDGWKRALTLSGLNPDHETKHGLTREEVIFSIRTLFTGNYPLGCEYLKHDNHHAALVGSGKWLFGSWRGAVEAAGLDYEKIVGHRLWTKEKLIDEIKKLNGQGIPLNPEFIEKYHCDLFASANVYFESWSQALDSAGVDYRLHYKTWSSKAWLRKLTDRETKKIIEQGRKQAKKRRADK